MLYAIWEEQVWIISIQMVLQSIDNKDFALYDKVKTVSIFHFADEQNVKLSDLSNYGITRMSRNTN